jgi:hypothetical protein
VPADLQEKALLGGDLSKLSSSERLSFYNSVCNSLGLNPLTRPFEYIQLNGKLTLYARKDCTEQLRSNRHISIEIASREIVDGVYVVRAKATQTAVSQLQQYSVPRTDESLGAVAIQNLQGEAKANAMMKAETKAKRRVTLSICGLGMLDETEIETIPGAKVLESIDAAAPRGGQTPRGEGLANVIVKSDSHIKPENGPVTQLPPAAVAPPQAQDSSGPYESLLWQAGSPPPKGHRGKPLEEVPSSYLDWYMKNGPQSQETWRDVARLELDRRNAQQVMEEEA